MFIFSRNSFTSKLTEYLVNCIQKDFPEYNIILSVGCMHFKFFTELCPRIGKLQNESLQVLMLMGKGAHEHKWKVLKPVQQCEVSEALLLTLFNVFFPSSP